MEKLFFAEYSFSQGAYNVDTAEGTIAKNVAAFRTRNPVDFVILGAFATEEEARECCRRFAETKETRDALTIINNQLTTIKREAWEMRDMVVDNVLNFYDKDGNMTGGISMISEGEKKQKTEEVFRMIRNLCDDVSEMLRNKEAYFGVLR